MNRSWILKLNRGATSTVALTFRLWSMFSGCRWNFWSTWQTPFSGAPEPAHTHTHRAKAFRLAKKQQRQNSKKRGRKRVFVTHPAILVLIFLNDVVDCVQELFDGARYVSVQRNRKRVRRHLNLQLQPITFLIVYFKIYFLVDVRACTCLFMYEQCHSFKKLTDQGIFKPLSLRQLFFSSHTLFEGRWKEKKERETCSSKCSLSV